MLQIGGVATIIKLPASFEMIHLDAFQIASRAIDVAALVAPAAAASDISSSSSSSEILQLSLDIIRQALAIH